MAQKASENSEQLVFDLADKLCISVTYDIHSPRGIISTVCDFPYKIIEKCFQ